VAGVTVQVPTAAQHPVGVAAELRIGVDAHDLDQQQPSTSIKRRGDPHGAIPPAHVRFTAETPARSDPIHEAISDGRPTHHRLSVMTLKWAPDRRAL
jgi:hypothetical protein